MMIFHSPWYCSDIHSCKKSTHPKVLLRQATSVDQMKIWSSRSGTSGQCDLMLLALHKGNSFCKNTKEVLQSRPNTTFCKWIQGNKLQMAYWNNSMARTLCLPLWTFRGRYSFYLPCWYHCLFFFLNQTSLLDKHIPLPLPNQLRKDCLRMDREEGFLYIELLHYHQMYNKTISYAALILSTYKMVLCQYSFWLRFILSNSAPTPLG